jgi:hypothetical protein
VRLGKLGDETFEVAHILCVVVINEGKEILYTLPLETAVEDCRKRSCSFVAQ